MPIENFATPLIAAYQAGVAERRAAEDQDFQRQQRKLQMDVLTHQTKALKIQDALEQFRALQGQRAQETQFPVGQPGTMSPTPAPVTPDGDRPLNDFQQTLPSNIQDLLKQKAGMQAAPIEQGYTGTQEQPLQSVTVPFEAGPVTLQPQSAQDLVRQSLQQKVADERIKSAFQRITTKPGEDVTDANGNLVFKNTNPSEGEEGLTEFRAQHPEMDAVTSRQQYEKGLADAKHEPTDTERYLTLYGKIKGGMATPQDLVQFEGLKQKLTLPAVTVNNLAKSGNPGAVENVNPKLIPAAMADFTKAGQTYADAAQASDDMKTFIDLASQGNKLAYSYAPTEGVLTLNTGRGVKRVNFAEIASYGATGSALDRVKAFLGKAATGASIPADVLADMKTLHDQVAGNAKTRYQRGVQVINHSYGSQFEPIDFNGNAASGSNAKPATITMPGGSVLTLGADGNYHAPK